MSTPHVAEYQETLHRLITMTEAVMNDNNAGPETKAEAQENLDFLRSRGFELVWAGRCYRIVLRWKLRATAQRPTAMQ